MSGIIDDAIYYLAAPLRLFGRSRRFRLAVMAVAVVAVFFAATLWALDRFMPAGPSANQVAAKLENPSSVVRGGTNALDEVNNVPDLVSMHRDYLEEGVRSLLSVGDQVSELLSQVAKRSRN